MIQIDLSKHHELNVDPIKQINFVANLDLVEQTFVFFIYEQKKKTIYIFLQGTVRVL